MAEVTGILAVFNGVLGVHYEPKDDVRREAERFLDFLGDRASLDRATTESLILADINAKFRLNADGIGHFLSRAARVGVTFNYHEKRKIGHAFDSRNETVLRTLVTNELSPDQAVELLEEVRWVTPEQTLRRLHEELRSATLTRKDSKPRDWGPEILEGLFTALLANAFGINALHDFNDPRLGGDDYEPDFWLYLQQRYPALYSEKPRLVVLNGSGQSQTSLLAQVQTAYRILPEFGYLAVLFAGTDGPAWQLVGDTILYAEKHIRRRVDNGFFRKGQVASTTLSCVPEIDLARARFEIWNDGFYYQDCFVCDGSPTRLLLLLQKREANEMALPCPSCRSLNVQGNSYPSLGVKSWECANILCPDKSKFGRGKRYSFAQLLKQAAIEEPGNAIPPTSVKAWLRDVQSSRSDAEILEMLVRHYSLANDTILIDASERANESLFGRTLTYEPVIAAPPPAAVIPPQDFFDSEWFARYDVRDSTAVETVAPRVVTEDTLTAFEGDAAVALRALSSNWVDGAVTSPPYYNAREYSQWANIYCYLHEMRRVNTEVFRVLKPGGYYLYNIFDYFDNENTVALSAMGEKRITLAAYTMDLFRRIGFECTGNIVWDKGDIEGKRGFNGGNYSPYYQAPFNCWEHILVFRKPGLRSASLEFPVVARQGAVIKMVAGKNVHGHTAPFPEFIPALLASRLSPGATLLDPFAGSMTTAVAAARAGCRSICVEKDAEYFALGLRRFRESMGEFSLL